MKKCGSLELGTMCATNMNISGLCFREVRLQTLRFMQGCWGQSQLIWECSDEVAEHVIATLDELQVEHSRCRQYEGENGYARVTLVDGDRVFLGSNKGGVLKENPLNLDVEDLEYIKTFDHVHTTNNSYFDEQLPKLAEQGISVSYDFSGQWIDEERVKKVAPYITYAFLSCGSVSREDAEEICKKMFRAGCPMVIATRGSYGAVLFDGTQFYEQPPHLVEAVDTLGAGDSFATAFLLSFLESRKKYGIQMKESIYEKEIRKALEAGAEFSSKTCMVQGAFGHGKSF